MATILNIEKQLPKIKNLLILSEIDLFRNIEIFVDDVEDFNDNQLETLIIGAKISKDTHPEFNEMGKLIIEIGSNFDKIMEKIGFDRYGNIKKPSEGNLRYRGSMVLGVNYDYEDQEINIIFNCMFG